MHPYTFPPIKWVDLVTFDKEWLKDKTVVYFDDVDGVRKPLVLDKDGRQVYPTCTPSL